MNGLATGMDTGVAMAILSDQSQSKMVVFVKSYICLPANSGKLVINRRSEEDGSGMIGHRGQCCIDIGISVNVVPNEVEYSHAMVIFDKLEKA